MDDGPRFLLCSNFPLTENLGSPRVLAELAAGFRELDVQVDTLSALDLGLDDPVSAEFISRLHAHLRRHSAEYDVIDYDHEQLPFPRNDFAPRTLMVARSVLLVQHLETRPIPRPRTLRSMLGRVVYERKRRRETKRRIAIADMTTQQADLINVSNADDKTELIRRGIGDGKIAVIPFGISRTRRALFDAISPAIPAGMPKIAFVGTFDYRKGAREFPSIVDRISRAIPSVGFKLLGTKGLFPTREAIIAAFPPLLVPRLEIVARFAPNELPALLADCWCGIFPTYLEGFPFGVLEMLAAGLPVVAYDAPGPPEMLGREWLVPAGAADQMAAKVIRILSDLESLRVARAQAQNGSRKFNWPDVARQTLEVYLRHLESHRRGLQV
jgi:glycosyltransferase involved in cell wall biosynthesis